MEVDIRSTVAEHGDGDSYKADDVSRPATAATTITPKDIASAFDRLPAPVIER